MKKRVQKAHKDNPVCSCPYLKRQKKKNKMKMTDNNKSHSHPQTDMRLSVEQEPVV